MLDLLAKNTQEKKSRMYIAEEYFVSFINVSQEPRAVFFCVHSVFVVPIETENKYARNRKERHNQI